MKSSSKLFWIAFFGALSCFVVFSIRQQAADNPRVTRTVLVPFIPGDVHTVVGYNADIFRGTPSVQIKIGDPDSIEKLRNAMNADYRFGPQGTQSSKGIFKHWVIAFCFDDGQTSVHELYESSGVVDCLVDRDKNQYNAPQTLAVLGDLFVKGKLHVVGRDEVIKFVPDFSEKMDSCDRANALWKKSGMERRTPMTKTP